MTIPIDAGRLIGALVAAATALFLLSGQLPARYRRGAMIAALATYGVVCAGVVVWVVLWLIGATL